MCATNDGRVSRVSTGAKRGFSSRPTRVRSGADRLLCRENIIEKKSHAETSAYGAGESARHRNGRGKNRKLRPRIAKNRVDTCLLLSSKTTDSAWKRANSGYGRKGLPNTGRPRVLLIRLFFFMHTHVYIYIFMFIFDFQWQTRLKTQKKPQIHTKVPEKRARDEYKTYFIQFA